MSNPLKTAFNDTGKEGKKGEEKKGEVKRSKKKGEKKKEVKRSKKKGEKKKRENKNDTD